MNEYFLKNGKGKFFVKRKGKFAKKKECLFWKKKGETSGKIRKVFGK